jgi:arylsulfatase A-like enzyme
LNYHNPREGYDHKANQNSVNDPVNFLLRIYLFATLILPGGEKVSTIWGYQADCSLRHHGEEGQVCRFRNIRIKDLKEILSLVELNRFMITAMKKKSIVSLIVVILAAIFLCPQSGTGDPAQQKPLNVLFLVVDDLNTWLLSNPDRYTGRVIAPNILRLAESGVNFGQAFTSSPKCSPSRTSFLSGVAPWKSGVYDNGMDVSASPVLQMVPSMPKVFQQNGYTIASFGKISHGYDTGVEWDDRINHSRDPAPPDAPLNGWAVRADGTPTEKDWGPTHLPESEMNDTKYADAAISQLKKNHNKPFFIACGLFHPHFPWYVPQKYLDMYPLENIELPPVNPDDQDDIPEMGRDLINTGLNESIISHNQVKEAIQGYLASTTYADAQMGRVLDALEMSPYKNNTVVVLMSDHGFHLGEKQHWTKGTLWEEATNCLLMFRVPGLTKPDQVCRRPVTLLDVYPTLMELTGLPEPEHLDGQSLVPLLEETDAPWGIPALTAYQSHIAARNDLYRLIRYTDGSTELYDRGQDPNEWVNQTENPEYSSIKKQMAALLPGQDHMAPSVPKN